MLNEADLFMKPVQQKRRVGDSKRTDGLLWRARGLSAVGSHDGDEEEAASGSESDEVQQDRDCK